MSVLSRVFRSFSDAQAAREALIAAGFGKEQVSLSARHDEAGPVENNFAIGNGAEDPSLGSAPSPDAGGESDNPYQRNFGGSVDQGIFVLTVDAGEGADQQTATDVMSRCGAVDIDELTGARGNSG
jgi:hypothetical protein